MSERRQWVVLVTGCSSGIGRALARELHGRGHRCFATARRVESLRELGEEGLETLPLDVTDAVSIDAGVRAALGRAGRIDMVVNNAGFSVFGPLAEVSLDAARRLFETNLFGALAVVQAVLPHMGARRCGRIVNVGSMVGVVPTPFAGVYCASKAALHAMSEVLRMEVEPLGVEVVVVQPGAVRSSVAEKSAVDRERYAGASSLYRAVAGDIDRRAAASQADPMATEEFARRLAAAITAARAPRVVRLGNRVGALRVLERLPGAVRDRLFARQFGLDKLRRSSRATAGRIGDQEE